MSINEHGDNQEWEKNAGTSCSFSIVGRVRQNKGGTQAEELNSESHEKDGAIKNKFLKSTTLNQMSCYTPSRSMYVSLYLALLC